MTMPRMLSLDAQTSNHEVGARGRVKVPNLFHPHLGYRAALLVTLVLVPHEQFCHLTFTCIRMDVSFCFQFAKISYECV